MAALVVVVALIVAIWPSGSDDVSVGPSPTDASVQPVPGATQSASTDDIAAARASTALAPCPTGTHAPTGSKLAGITVPCLGSDANVDVGAAVAGVPTLINFWAPWCLPCRQELPVLQEFSQRAAGRVKVLLVQAKEGSENPVLALGLLSETKTHLASVIDNQSKIAAALGIPHVYPVSVLLRADGTIAKVLPQVFDSVDQFVDAANTNVGASL